MLAGNTIQDYRSISKIESLIGNTPLIDLSNLGSNPEVKIFGKAEWLQFGGSIKIRPAYNMIKALEQKLKGKKLLDASSGNMAIAYASIGAMAGISVTIVIPENASKSRISILKGLGTELIFSSPLGGTDEAQDIASEIYSTNPDVYQYVDQYNNENNWKAHYHGTGEEIWNQTKGKITHFVTALGTSGSFTGISRKLKEKNSNIMCISLQPESAMHIMEGWKHLETARIPGIYDPFIADKQLLISNEETVDILLSTAKNEGLLLSPSAAANLKGALKVAYKMDNGVVVTLLPDNGDKYADLLDEIL